MEEAAPSPDSNYQPGIQLQDFDFAFVISDARQPDNPVCFASQEFYRLTGFCSSEVLGRNCRFMQGRETELRKVGMKTYGAEEHRQNQGRQSVARGGSKPYLFHTLMRRSFSVFKLNAVFRE